MTPYTKKCLQKWQRANARFVKIAASYRHLNANRTRRLDHHEKVANKWDRKVQRMNPGKCSGEMITLSGKFIVEFIN